MTDGQRMWMTTYIAKGLQTLGLTATPQALEQEFQRMGLRGASLRTLAGKRHSAPDQQHLNDAHDAVAAAGATCGDPRAAAAPDPYKSASVQIDEAIRRMETHLNTAHGHLAAAGADCPDNGVKAAAAYDDHRDDDPPSGYASVLDNRAPIQSDIEPDFDPNYKPHGAAPDAYKLALAFRQITKEDA